MNRQRGMGVENGTISNPQRMDVGIIIALREEFAEFHQQIRDCCTPIQDRSTGRAYYQFIRNSNNSDQAYNCVATFVGEMGETQCALHTEELISKWQPETVVMLGIAGGISKDVKLGDIVVATQVDNYLARSKAVTATDGAGFEFERGGEAYRPSDDLINFARNLQFVQESCFQQWIENCANERQDLISKEKCDELAGLNLLRERVSWFDGHIASGPTVGAARAFSEWLKGGDRNYLALEMEAAGLMAAVYRKADPARTLLLRGISDYADERKSGLDRFKDGAFRRYAMRNAIHFLWSLLNAGVLPVVSEAETASQEVSVTPARSDKPLDPQKISLAKLPSTELDLFGRDKELKMLDEAWDDPETRVISLMAFGGMGKSALVNVWLNGMEKDHYRNAKQVYGWSFYSQGASEGAQSSADEFIAAALGWFGDTDPTEGTPWDKGERLAELVKKQRTLLILDGLEPLQNPPGQGEGEIKDPSLKCLLRELARQNPGLCVITTRLRVDDLKEYAGTSVKRVNLEELSQEAGAQLLRNLGADGTEGELKQAVDEFDGHALALTLLGRYLAVVYKGDIRQRDKIPALTEERRQGGHARRVMESYERWFEGKPELGILRIMGLFERPAAGGAIEAVRAEPVIEGLTAELKLSHADWQFALSNLREVRLLAPEDTDRADSLDCHPLIREHFGEKLRESDPAAWKEAHSRLYEYYKSRAKELPDTIEEMASLYAAVRHGCQAGRYQETLIEVFWQRILRKDEFFSTRKLGASSADLSALSGFFDPPWSQPVDELTEGNKAGVLNWAGSNLRALGRLTESAQPMQASLEAVVAQKEWRKASIPAGNLSELHLTIGDVSWALDYARQSVELADRSGDAFERMARRTTFADALHQSGQLQESEASFCEAEELQKKRQPGYPILYSLWGFRYCDLLLGQGKHQKVQDRAGQTLEWDKQTGEASLLDFALDHLSLGRAHLLQAQVEGTGDFTSAAGELDQAVDGLRQAGQQHYLPRGLLARAELHRVCGDLDRAQRDLDEAMTIATRGGMRLYKADCHLGYARLYLAMGEKEKARESLNTAKEMIEKMGYHRRDKDVEELGNILDF